MTADQVVDWLAEPRLPHHAPLWLWRMARYARPALSEPQKGPVQIALTFDVEQDLGSVGTPERWESCLPFLEWLGSTAAARDWRTTLFVQGSIVAPLAPLLKPLVGQHEIGLHGYYHELWGRPLWFTPQAGTPRVRRAALLSEGIDAFEAAGLPRPRSFRAPNLVCDEGTLRLLEEQGFALDSSAAAYRGCAPFVTRWRSLVRVPVSASPRPRIRRRAGLPSWASYPLLNVPTLLDQPPELLGRLVDEILALQTAFGSPRHLTVLAHPWEFADIPEWGCSPANYDRLVERIDWLTGRFPSRLSALSEVARCDPNERGEL